MNGYICLYKGKKVEVEAETSYKAQQIATEKFQKLFPKNKVKGFDISTNLAEKDGKQVTTHSESLEEGTSMKSIYTAGKVAAKKGLPFTKNPYDHKDTTAEYIEWKRGWSDMKGTMVKESHVSKVLQILEGAASVTIEKSQGEYRVPAVDGYEDGAHYTDSKEDAIAVAKKVFGDEVVIKYRSVAEFVGGKYEKYRPKGKKNEGLDEGKKYGVFKKGELVSFDNGRRSGKNAEIVRIEKDLITVSYDGRQICLNRAEIIKEGKDDWKNTGVCPKCKGTDIKNISMDEKQCNSCKHKWNK